LAWTSAITGRAAAFWRKRGIILEQKMATTPEAMKEAFAKIPQSLIALETGTHSPWVSRLLAELKYEVIVAPQKAQLITKNNRKDNRHAEPVRARTALVNAARGLVKSYGQRLSKCGTQQVSREHCLSQAHVPCALVTPPGCF
jgi:transposase